jgi:uncharacterized protein
MAAWLFGVGSLRASLVLARRGDEFCSMLLTQSAADATRLARDVEVVRGIVMSAIAGRGWRAWLFGSVATGIAYRSSDIDVAISGPVPAGVMLDLRDSLEDAPILRSVDLVDLTRADPALADAVATHGVEWTT